jgi:hypothetical protein
LHLFDGLLNHRLHLDRLDRGNRATHCAGFDRSAHRNAGRRFCKARDGREKLVHHMARRLQAGCGLQDSPQQSQVNDTDRHQRRQGQAFLLRHGFRQWINHRWRLSQKPAHSPLPSEMPSLVGKTAPQSLQNEKST